jgi:glyoxylase-like metal-dependent hydrolase (beta-lactamase superfamily II)
MFPITEKSLLDLGNRNIEVIEVPGHTRGSICFLDRESGDFFAGDACNMNTLIMGEMSASVEEYLEALLKLEKYEPLISRFYQFHGESLSDKSCIDDNIECCKEILSGTDDHIKVNFLGMTGYLAKERAPQSYVRKDGRIGNIMYSEEKVKKEASI